MSEILVDKDISYHLEKESDEDKINVIRYVMAIQREFWEQREEMDSTVKQALLQVAIEETELEKIEQDLDL